MFVNCYSVQPIKLKDGRVFHPSGIVTLVNGEPKYPWTKLRDLPDPKEGVTYIVSPLVFDILKEEGKRLDFVTVKNSEFIFPMLKVFVNHISQHPLVMNDGRVFEPTGVVPTVQADFRRGWYSKVYNMPEPKDGVTYIVSEQVFEALRMEGKRKDFVTRNFENCKRNENGCVVSFESFLYP
jgi:hypothetical protein